ncbi:MAG TPA: hypothetical protein VHP32_07390 [Ignavibacteria bacterium]|nr:hypothetical protein [Ignavibacteria bacterium]
MLQQLKQGKVILALSIPLALCVVIASYYGIFTNLYKLETTNWNAQAIGQDIIDLFVVTPVLLIAAFLSYNNHKTAMLIWGGTVIYLLYTFLIYTFSVHFNSMFIVYCFALGLSFYSFLYFILCIGKEELNEWFSENAPVKFTAVYFIIIFVMFYFLWLSQIIPAISGGTVPADLRESGLFTNPVHVIDLSIFLPAILLTAIFLLRKNPLGFLLAPAILMFFILMDITLAFLIVVMNSRGIESSYTVAIIMSILAVFSLFVLMWWVRWKKK